MTRFNSDGIHLVILSLGLAFLSELSLPRVLYADHWAHELADSSGNTVGERASIDLDPSGNPHIAHYDGTDLNLRYSRKATGAWTTEIVDGASTDVGRGTSIRVDASGNPHIAYPNHTSFDLRYARKAGGAWTLETVDGATRITGQLPALALAGVVPHISYFDIEDAQLRYATKAGGVWQIEVVDPGPFGISIGSSITTDSDGNPHITYYDLANGNLNYARKTLAGIWLTDVLDGSANDVGDGSSLELDAAGAVHVTYTDATDQSMKYLVKTATSLIIETVASFGGSDFYSLELDTREVPHVLVGLKYAQKIGGSWASHVVLPPADEQAQGFALGTDGTPHMAYWDFATRDLGYAYGPALTAVRSVVKEGALLSAYPNPLADGPLHIAFTGLGDQTASVGLYDIQGRLVTSVRGRHAAEGVSNWLWEGNDEEGKQVGSGVYLLRLDVGERSEAMRITVVR